MAKDTDRFVIVHKEGSSLKDEGYRQLLVDRETGVTYLLWKSGYGAAMTPLIDEEGKPVITRL